MGNHIDAQKPAHTCGCLDVDDCPACNINKDEDTKQSDSKVKVVKLLEEIMNNPCSPQKDVVKSAELLLGMLPAPEEVTINFSSDNNGGATDYYRIKDSWTMAQDVIEDRAMNYSQGNIFKVAFCFNQGRHDATSYERELNKIIYFAQRELDRIKGN